MVVKHIGAFEARRQFGQMLKGVSGRGTHYMVEYHGEPVAALVPMHVYEQWKCERDAFFDELEAIAKRSGMTAEEADELALAEIAADRRGE